MDTGGDKKIRNMVGRVTPCAPRIAHHVPNGAHGMMSVPIVDPMYRNFVVAGARLPLGDYHYLVSAGYSSSLANDSRAAARFFRRTSH